MNRDAPEPVPRSLQEPDRVEGDPLAALAGGDPAPFEAFVEAETPLLLSFFRGLGAARSESEDLAQETFLKLFRSRDHYSSRGLFRGYTYRVARNVWIDRSRRRVHEPRSEPAQAPGERPDRSGLAQAEDPTAIDPARAAATDEAGSWIKRALTQLPEGQRLAFELGVVRELPYNEVAEALEIPVGTVKSRVYHAVRRLRELLEPLETPAAEPARRAADRPAPTRRREEPPFGGATSAPLRFQA